MGLGDKLGKLAGCFGSSLKSMVKIAVESRGRTRVKAPEAPALPLVVMGNGPSLNDTIACCRRQLEAFPLLAVNFAALSPEFAQLRPRYYVLADPVFFDAGAGGNVARLREAFARIDWPVTLFVPVKAKGAARRLAGGNGNIHVAGFNPVGVEGFEWLEDKAFDLGLGMPRPRNVLIPSLMIAISLGFRTIYVAGADHSWMKTLDVTDDNTVVSVQPHFYSESKEEKARVTSVYKDVRLHEVVYSFYVAFRSYFTIERYARRKGVTIFNVTPGSFIDAFQRCNLATVSVRPE